MSLQTILYNEQSLLLRRKIKENKKIKTQSSNRADKFEFRIDLTKKFANFWGSVWEIRAASTRFRYNYKQAEDYPKNKYAKW